MLTPSLSRYQSSPLTLPHAVLGGGPASVGFWAETEDLSACRLKRARFHLKSGSMEYFGVSWFTWQLSVRKSKIHS